MSQIFTDLDHSCRSMRLDGPALQIATSVGVHSNNNRFRRQGRRHRRAQHAPAQASLYENARIARRVEHCQICGVLLERKAALDVPEPGMHPNEIRPRPASGVGFDDLPKSLKQQTSIIGKTVLGDSDHRGSAQMVLADVEGAVRQQLSFEAQDGLNGFSITSKPYLLGETIYVISGLATNMFQEHHCVSSGLLCEVYIFGGGEMTVRVGRMYVEEILAAPALRSQSGPRHQRRSRPSNAEIQKRVTAGADCQPGCR